MRGGKAGLKIGGRVTSDRAGALLQLRRGLQFVVRAPQEPVLQRLREEEQEVLQDRLVSEFRIKLLQGA